MHNNIQNRKNKISPTTWVRNSFDIVRGIMYIAVGAFMMQNKNVIAGLGKPLAVGLASVIILYGVFRIWRFYYNYKNKIEY